MDQLDAEGLAEFVAEKARADPHVQKILADVKLLDHLRDDAGWRILHRRIQEQKKKYLLSIARQLMRGEKVDSELVSYMRGYYNGARDTVEQPARAAENLERAARAAWLEVELEIENATKEESAYA